MRILNLFFATIFTITIAVTVEGQNIDYKEMMQDPSYNFYDVCKAADLYFETHPSGKGSGYKPYQRWKAENEPKYFPSGDRSTVSPNFVAEQYGQFLKTEVKNQRDLFNGEWKELGPFHANNISEGYNPGIGRVEAFWVNPNNSQHLFLGSRSGGFWKSLDGGQNWKNTTDFLVASGVNTIAVSPFNNDTVLINVRNGGNTYTHGVYQSADGGDTWTISNFNPSNLGWGGLGAADRIFVIKYHPTVSNLVFVGTSNGFYRSTDNLQTWTQLLNSTDVTEITFHPTNPNIIYLYDDNYSSSNSNKILRSTNKGVSFSTSSTISGNASATGYISTTPMAPNNVYFASRNGVWKSTDEGINFTLLSVPTENCDGFSVSDVDSNAMIYGALNIQASINGGASFKDVTAWESTNPGTDYVHADLRASGCVNGVFYIGTDGYLAKSSDNGKNWTRVNDGTAIREFYASGVSQSQYNVYMAGSQDNGTSVLKEDGWIEWNGGDGMEAIVHPLNPNWMMGSWQFGTRSVTKDGGFTRQGAGNPDGGSGISAWQAPLLIDPNQQMGVYHFSDKIYRTDDFSSGWYLVAEPNIGILNVAAVAENNSNIMAVSRSSTLKITEDMWVTDRIVSLPLPNIYISDIAFDPRRDSTIIVTFSTYQNNGKKVFITNNLGDTWSNITYNLGSMPIRSVVIDHSDSSYIYVGAEIGIYVKSMNGTTWELYNPNLPNVTVKDLEIQYGSNTLKAATWGRGLWEYNLKGRADYPAILTTKTTDLPTNIFPRAGYDQFVSSVISYNQNVTSAFVRWSNDSKDLDNIIPMSNVSDSTWKSDIAIKNFGMGTDIYFKVFAVGQNNDTTETYRFHYKVRQGININSVQEKEFEQAIKLYPNPSTGQFTVVLPSGTGEVLLKVFDVNGKMILQKRTVNREIPISLNVPNGNYVLSITNGNITVQKKFIIE